MKHIKQTAIAMALAGMACAAVADTVYIQDGNENTLVEYSADAVSITGGVITLTNGQYQTGAVPGSGVGESVACDPVTTTLDSANNLCVGAATPDPSIYCGDDAVWNPSSEMCEGVAPLGPAPTLSISTNDSNLGTGETATLTFSFSEDVMDFTVGDISATNGSIGSFSGSGDTYTATFTPTPEIDATAVITVDDDSYVDTDNLDGEGDSLSITLSGEPAQVGNCTVPSNVNVSNESALASIGTVGSMQEFRIPQNNILSVPFTTDSSMSERGKTDLFGEAGESSTLTRKIWVSECPGGEPVATCAQKLGNDISLKWSKDYYHWSYCAIGNNVDLYLNVKHVNEDSCSNSSRGCVARVSHTSS
ncbi:hypothetical protein KO507_17605 [Gilvimarinus agarilyticus]|uniref:Ig-like domain-containing protein n=1 Tax=Gilvimarinus sp. 2_MG-2023 TaxID=3062666 RepID=UPI001C0941E3|nr:Ig-like domain-containing protein [Gilvimarinus sp. 2_MG-2023]MBU2887585.1 hypothetical protein [Gilvimarinus agarilyticus]MDO6572236.1 Ig-like domain-containing protein [Gilvimarinus sp. 2_MG-2023]